MIRKLAVTIFALSFAAIGCGSDSGTAPKLDAASEVRGSETGAVSEVQLSGSEVQVAPKDVSGVDSPAGEAGGGEVRTGEVGTGQQDTGKPDGGGQASEVGGAEAQVIPIDVPSADTAVTPPPPADAGAAEGV